MAKKKTIPPLNAVNVGYAPVKWKGHTLKVVALAEGGVLCVTGNVSHLPTVVYFVPSEEIEQT
jgi:hypothetical protein